MDLTGVKFNRLTVIERYDTDKFSKRIWRCVCICGNIKLYATGTLNSGLVKSCGCWKNEQTSRRAKKGVFSKHSHARVGMRSREYSTWNNMVQRCTNPRSVNYKYYGGRGVKVCQSWLNSFQTFLNDMGLRPLNMSLDQINTNGNYELNNCKWSTSKEQMKNRRNLDVKRAR